MIDNKKYVTLSLELHLFFGRIMKEHSIFLEAGFTPKNTKFSKEAEEYKNKFERLLYEVIKISRGIVRDEVLNSGEIFTEFTLDAERKTEEYLGIGINSKLTKMEKELLCDYKKDINYQIVKEVKEINCRAKKLVNGLINFKMCVLDGMLTCNMYTTNYPLLIEHIIREAKLYHSYISDLDNDCDIEKEDPKKIELFWDRIMMEHALFIRGLLDPSENDLFNTSDEFSKDYANLLKRAADMNEETMKSFKKDTIDETIKIRDFKKAGTEGLINCKIKSIIVPLLADHVLREANHFLRLLKQS
ncbi:MAG: DUF2935 domain-containing protein [Clostridiales bacterium]|nr:DUF2935 domain-containing protein [Clostridiales bacterium]